jgi:hypothetical protein
VTPRFFRGNPLQHRRSSEWARQDSNLRPSDCEIPLPGLHYGLREHDLIAFTAQHRPAGQPPVENGTRGQVSAINKRGVILTLDGSQRRVQLAGEHLDSLRLAYARHVYHQQGATVERSRGTIPRPAEPV